MFMDPSETDYVDEDVVVMRSTEGSAVLLPAAFKRLHGESLEIATGLQRVAVELVGLQEDQETLVNAARGAGLSWSLIGWLVGTTGEAARQRWGNIT